MTAQCAAEDKGKAVDWAELGRQTTDLLKGVAWPIAAGCIAWMFRKEIPALVGRIREAEALGAKLRLDAPRQQDVSAAAAPASAGPPPEPTEASTKETHETTAEAEQASISSETHLAENQALREALSRATEAGNRFSYEAWAERLHRNLFLSQFELLVHLEPLGSAGATEGDAKNFYAEHVKRAEAIQIPPTPFAMWAGFLVSWTVLEINGTRYLITPNGRWFLGYARSHGLPQALIL